MAKKTKTLEELKAEYDAVLADYEIVNAKMRAAGAEYRAALTKEFLASPEFNVPELVKHSHWNEGAYRKMNEYVRSLGLKGYTYWGPDANPYSRVGPEFTLGKNENPTKAIWAIRRFCKTFADYCENEDGEVFIDFMENTLSEFGSYSVYWKPADDSARLSKITYGRRNDVFTGSLREVMKYVAAHHWYGEPDEEEE